MDPSSEKVFKFSCNLMNEILKNEPNKNIVFSPLGIVEVLKMAMLGASGNTKTEIEEVLHVSKECSTEDCDKDVHSNIKKLLSDQTGKKYELKSVCGLFGEKTITFLEPYLQLLKKNFNVELNVADFKQNAEVEIQRINEWVNCLTNGKITDLYAKGSLDQSSAMALVNAMYFKGLWAIKFNPENTKEEPFNVNKNEKKNVPMMCHSGKFKCTTVPEIKSKVLMLPYQGDLSMILVLPDEIEGLKEVLPKITSELVTSWAQKENQTETEVEVKLPKFKLEANYDLKPKLMDMGMKEVFLENADLSGMSDSKNLMLSNIAHKSFIEVNEEGTEATAATGAAVSVTSATIPESYTFNRPFVFCIVTNNDLLTIFQGTVFSP